MGALAYLGRPLNRDDIHAAAAVLIERALSDPNTRPHSASRKPSPCREYIDLN
jgi:hypothetical protein